MQFSMEVIGQCNPSLTLCPKCPSDRHASSWEYSPRFSWGLSLFCSQCDTVWMVCRKCPKLRNHFRSGSEMLRHNKKRHANESRPSPSSRLSPSSHPSSSGGKRSIAEVEEAVAAEDTLRNIIKTVRSTFDGHLKGMIEETIKQECVKKGIRYGGQPITKMSQLADAWAADKTLAEKVWHCAFGVFFRQMDWENEFEVKAMEQLKY